MHRLSVLLLLSLQAHPCSWPVTHGLIVSIVAALFASISLQLACYTCTDCQYSCCSLSKHILAVGLLYMHWLSVTQHSLLHPLFMQTLTMVYLQNLNYIREILATLGTYLYLSCPLCMLNFQNILPNPVVTSPIQRCIQKRWLPNHPPLNAYMNPCTIHLLLLTIACTGQLWMPMLQMLVWGRLCRI